jgi:hypothetical protein
VNQLCAISNAIALVAKGNKNNQAILNEDILTAAVGRVAVLETKELRPAGGSPEVICNIRSCRSRNSSTTVRSLQMACLTLMKNSS